MLINCNMYVNMVYIYCKFVYMYVYCLHVTKEKQLLNYVYSSGKVGEK